MALVLNERVKETTTTTGTGALSLGGAPTGFETFAAGIGNSNTTYYAIFHATADEFEVGLGTLDGDSSDLTRTTVYASSNSDSAVNFSAGTKTVFCTMPAARSVFLDADGDVTLGANLDVGGNLTVTGTTTFNGGTLTLGDANTDNIVFGGEVDSDIIPDDDGTFDLGSASKEWQDLFIDGTAKVDTLTVDENATVAGTLGVTGVLTANAGVVVDEMTIDGDTITTTDDFIIDAAADITLDAAGGDILLKNGGTTYGQFTESSTNFVIKSTTSDKDILFKGNDGGSEVTALTLDMSAGGQATFNSEITASGTSNFVNLDISGDVDVDGTLEADAITVNGTALASVIAGTTVANATLAATVTVTDSTSNTNFPVVFHDESNALLDDTGALRYNPSTGELLVPKLTVAGTTTTVDTVTMNAANAVIFEGATADAHETTLTIIDPTGDRTINLPNVSGTIPVLAAASTTQITSTPEELNLLDGITAGTVSASLAVIADSNKDITGFRNVGLSGNLTIADDKQIIFGTNSDITMEYDENGTDTLLISSPSTTSVTISGAFTNFKIQDTDAGGSTTPAYRVQQVSGLSIVTLFGANDNDGELQIQGGKTSNVAFKVDASNRVQIHNKLIPDASGGADIGSSSLEFGDVYIADDKQIKFGNDQDVSIEYDEDGTNTMLITGNVTFADGSTDVNIASHDTSNGLKLGGTLVTATAAELNFTDGVTSNIQTQLNTKTTPGFALAMAVAL